LATSPRVAPFQSIRELGEQTAAVIARHMNLTFRELIGRGRNVTSDDRYARLITGLSHPFGNFALLESAVDEATVREAVEPLAKCGSPALTIFMEHPSSSAEAVVLNLGFKLEEAMPLMAVEIDRLPIAQLPPGYSFVRIGDDSAIKDKWTRAFAEGYEFPKEVGDAFASSDNPLTTAPDAPRQFFAVERDGELVATTMLRLAQGLAGIYCVSTIPAERGKGLGAYCTVEPLRRARELGYRVGILQASPAGHPVYFRLGFAAYGQVPVYLRIPN
jgi:hypothetical protein